MRDPSIAVVVPVYNGERYVAESLEAVLAQTHPASEVIVVDDGSTDSTPDLLRRFGASIRVVRQANAGHPGAYNRGFAEARAEYVARCDADDIWEPTKLERQVAALRSMPQIDVAFGGAINFGLFDGLWHEPPGAGLLDEREFARAMYRANFVCSSTAVVRKALFERIGPFVDRLPCEDYDFWLRALKARAAFFYDPGTLVRYRRHSHNVTNDLVRMHTATHRVHLWHADLIDDPQLVGGVLAADRWRIARALVDDRRLSAARDAFVSCLRHEPSARGVAWMLMLSTPERYRDTLLRRAVSAQRALAT